MSKTFSIVSPTSNAFVEITCLLESIRGFAASDELIEILLVANGPGAEAFAEEFALSDYVQLPKIRVVVEPVGSLLAGRHRGALESSGDVICFVDDDVAVRDGWFDSLREAFSNPELVLAGGPSFGDFESHPPSWLAELRVKNPYGGEVTPFMSLLDLGGEEIVPVEPDYIWGLNFSIRRDTLFELGGFNPDIVPASEQMFQGDGETGLAKKIREAGFMAGYFPGVAVNHRIPPGRCTLAFLKKRAFYDGVCLEFTVLRHSGREKVGNRPFQLRLKLYSISLLKMVLLSVPDWFLSRKRNLLIQKHVFRGMRYLKLWYKKSSFVRTWVHKEDYWDYSHPFSALMQTR